MANVGDISVSIGLDTSGLNRSINEVNRTLGSVQQGMSGVSDASRQMAERMQDAYKKQKDIMNAFKVEQLAVQSQFLDLTQQSSNWSGTSDSFLAEVQKMGKAQKALTDQMLANNELMKMSFIQSVGTMLARSGQSEKIASNFERMGNPLYSVNNGLLQITGKLEGIARAGQPAVMALQMLGPTANMKQLQDMTMMIQQGIMRFQSVFLVASVASALFYGALHKQAMESNKAYAESFNEMKSALSEAFKPLVDVFAQVMPYIYDAITAVAKLVVQFQKANPTITKLIAGFLLLIPILTLILSPLAIGIGLFGGLKVAFASLAPLIMPLITGLGAMMGTVFLVAGAIVALIAVGVLLYKNWDAIVAWLQKAWEAIKATAVSVWGAIKEFFVSTWNSIKATAESIWNGIVTSAVSIFTSIVDFFKQWGIWILGVMGGAIGLLAVYIYKNWDSIKAKTVEIWNSIVAWFVGFATKVYYAMGIDNLVAMVVAVWNFLKTTTSIVFEMIVAIIRAIWLKVVAILTPIVQGIVNFFVARWNTLKSNTMTVFNAIKAVLSTIWNAIKSVVTSVAGSIVSFVSSKWSAIKSTTSSVFNAVKSVVSSVWNSIKSVVTSVASAIFSAISNKFNQIKSTVSSIFNSVKSTASTIWNGIKSTISSIVDGIRSNVQSKFDAVKSAMTKPIEDAKGKIKGMLDNIKSFFSNLKLKIPKPSLPKISVTKATKSFLGQEIPYPKFSVSWNAKGAIFNGATILGQGQGVAEAGTEAVIPMQHKRYMRPFVSNMAELLNDMQGGQSKGDVSNTFNIASLVVREEADVQRIASELERMQRKQQRAKGSMSFA